MRIESQETGRVLEFKVGDDLWYRTEGRGGVVYTGVARSTLVLVNNQAEADALGRDEPAGTVVVGLGFRPPPFQPFICFDGRPTAVWWEDVFPRTAEPLLLMHEPLTRSDVEGTARYFDARPAILGEDASPMIVMDSALEPRLREKPC